MASLTQEEPAGGAFSMFEHRTTGILYFIFGVIGVFVNLRILVILFRKNPMADSRYKLHAQFAIANTLVVACCPFSGSSAFVGSWLFGEAGCRLYGTESYTGGMGVATFAFLMCVQRALSTAYPEQYALSGGPGILCVLGWAYSLAVAIGPLFGWNSYIIETAGTACGLDWLTTDASHRSLFMLILGVNSAAILLSLVALRSAFSSTAAAPKATDSDAWFTDSQLNWIAVANLTISTIGFGPYGFFAAWTLVNHCKMTMLASVIPPLAAKMSTMFYPIAYMVASKRFRDEFFSIPGDTEVTKKAN